MKRETLPECPVETTLSFISSKWVILILRELFSNTKRFGELKKQLTPISQKVLTQQLRTMEKKGIVQREVYPEVPPRVEYSLTELGLSLCPVIDSMQVWGKWYKEHVE